MELIDIVPEKVEKINKRVSLNQDKECGMFEIEEDCDDKKNCHLD